MAKLIFDPQKEEVELPDGAPIDQVCEDMGVPFGCHEGTCGTCLINIEEGGENLAPQTKQEEEYFGAGYYKARLACQCRIKSGTVRISM